MFLFLFCRIEVEEEIRKQVDELMRQELKNLKMVCILHKLAIFCLLTTIFHTRQVIKSKSVWWDFLTVLSLVLKD